MLLKYLLKSYLHGITAPAHLYMTNVYMAFFAFWAAALIGDKVPKNGEIFGLYICLGHPAMSARPGWLAGWASDMAGWGNGQTENLPILQDFLIMCTRLHMSLCRSVSWSVGQSVQIHFAPLHFFLVFWAERRLDLSYSPAHPHTTDAIVCTALFPYQGRCPASPHENQ